MTRLTFAIILLASVWQPAFAQNQADKIRKEFLNASSKNILVAAHRAVHHQYPENSVPSIAEAVRLRIDIIEIDVQVSKDGIPMLMHDQKVDRTTNGKGNLEEMYYEALRKLRLVANGKVTNEKIPTLEEALQVAKGKLLIDLDLKTSWIEPIIEIVKKTKTEDIVFFFDSDYKVLSKVHAASEKLMMMPRAYNQAMADSAIRLFSPEVIHIDSKFNTTEVNEAIKKKNARVWINALGKPDEQIRTGNVKEPITALISKGANIVQTDEPQKILEYLRSANLHD
ncbi:glycerophosphodiester phosphodiesterase family protein [Dyadobacter sp. CY312]|uniref:glycerophosphodiester phosphodiesterase family protein n=1 Tax=Dyadobacter sp. CY312 TaxID=2907303 RepID=UPI001F200788|nr:glycerophosphodiester phosphodiesterase family protein [Dyadobacter sp. CY312]MCE7044407.1 glycerophosphodiester phosphodiesterase family protein [Dyadobacter sp. CY312]